MPILSLLAKLGLDKTGFDAALASANKQVASFGSGLKGQLAAGFGAAAAVAFVHSVIEAGDALDELSERLGISLEKAQQFGIAAKLGGSDAEFFANKFEKLRAALFSGAAEGKNPLEAFGIESTTDAADALEKLAEKISSTGLSAEQANKMVEIFGRGAGKMINILGDLETAKTGLLFNREEVNNAKKMADTFVLLKNDAIVFAARIVEAFQIIGKFGLQGFRKDEWFQADKESPSIASTNEAEILRQQAERAEEIEIQAKAHMATQDRINALDKEAADIQEKNRVSALSKEEQLVELAEKREEIFNRIAATEEERSRKALELAQNEASIIALSKSEKRPGVPHIESNQFGRIGVFTGASSQASLTANQQRSVEYLNQIHNLLATKGIVVTDARQ